MRSFCNSEGLCLSQICPKPVKEKVKNWFSVKSLTVHKLATVKGFHKCRGRESNSHAPYGTQDFKSCMDFLILPQNIKHFLKKSNTYARFLLWFSWQKFGEFTGVCVPVVSQI